MPTRINLGDSGSYVDVHQYPTGVGLDFISTEGSGRAVYMSTEECIAFITAMGFPALSKQQASMAADSCKEHAFWLEEDHLDDEAEEVRVVERILRGENS